MNRFLWVSSLLALGCGGGGQGANDAGSDVAKDVTHNVACDFPCRVDWSCTDSTHWVEMHTVVPPQCTSGAMCESTGVMHACDPGLECIKDPPSGSKVQCAYGGVEGCSPGDAGAFTPTQTPAPTREVNACDQPTLDQYWSRCIDPTTYDADACKYWHTNHASCIACADQAFILAPSDFQDQFPTVVANISGCYAALGDSSCAAEANANLQCAMAVCKDGCQTTPAAYSACIAGARKTTCSSYPVCNADAGSAYATCEASSEKDFFLGFGEALCGP